MYMQCELTALPIYMYCQVYHSTKELQELTL